MTDRTAEIIMICKKKHEFGDELNDKQAIAAYLSDQCLCDIKSYQQEVNDVIWAAALDYMDTIDRPSSFLRVAKDVYDRHNNPIFKSEEIDWYTAICVAFSLVRVKENGKWINGFTEKNTRCICKTN